MAVGNPNPDEFNKKDMSVERIIEISKNIVSFLLKNKEVGDGFRKVISIACPELQIFINDDKKLCEEYISTMIVHRIPGFPFPKQNSDSFLTNMLTEIKLSEEDFVTWVQKIKSDKELGLHFGVENPISPN